MKKLFLGVSVLMFTGTLMLNSNVNNEISLNEALAGGGTCCPGSGICYADDGTVVTNAWWRNDGKPCNSGSGGSGGAGG
ncbi:hypothetical protein Q4Q34_04005 [Flavivirga abyssicola]|uniref:hypothetical protein n=1 Tax=Flavivirga abyssicola TaxID=3063533 RepID=UPI0026E0314F|nr:hypothetical protein [Flavivirga sp. MEBiC07777]WVK14192.1 hypothetical protein Q4Q34_04005 [Flavivirga sp. MEBiC07777]